LDDDAVYINGIKEGELLLSIHGDHNRLNALAAFTVAKENGLTTDKIMKGLKTFKGTGRRFELLGKYKTALVYDDYAHHPTEIQTTLKAAREKFGKQATILAIFQPHQYSRTLKLIDNFKECFNEANEILITDIYEARDTKEDKQAINGKILAEKINHSNCKHSGSLEETIKIIEQKASKYDLILTMGAGDVYQVSKYLAEVNELSSK
jgi:UDP-N-acetylmuramate--alanine ligase